MSDNTLRRVEQACTDLLDTGQQVTFTTAVARTRLARTTLYRNQLLRAVVDEPDHRLRLNTPNSKATHLQKLAGQDFDNAMAGTVIGYYKCELIRGPARTAPWRTAQDVELATLAGSTGTNQQLASLPLQHSAHRVRDEVLRYEADRPCHGRNPIAQPQPESGRFLGQFKVKRPYGLPRAWP
jgi:hypothetical protein